jgi:Glucuronate isomerase
MKEFMGKDFLLDTKTANDLFYNYAKDMPIFDYHCHLIPKEIAENKRFSTITEAWLGGDHYKWRQMRTYGIDEKYITGDADPYEKFLAWAETMENLIGNPLYHWTHMELRRYFGIDLVLNRKNAKAIYDMANEKLKNDPDLDVKGIMKKFKVDTVGTTDDPIDDLHYHQVIRADKSFTTKVIPSFRPDKAINIEKTTFADYLSKLSAASGVKIEKAADVMAALEARLVFFIENGCKATDHGIEGPVAVFVDEATVDTILRKKLEGQSLTDYEIEAYKTYILTGLAKLYHKHNIVMQLHMAAIRDNNSQMFDRLGPDTGYDASHDLLIAEKLSAFMKYLSAEGAVPKTILYSLNPKDYYTLGTLMGCYQGDGIKGKIQLGSGWWFCDHKDGMEEQMKVLGNLGMLPLFVGMLTDSRSFLSYSRHEYFRRIMCNLLGTWIENGEIPNDVEAVGKIAQNISFNNAKAYFG